MYFYAVSRRDLSISQQAIQCAHAQHEHCRLHPGSLEGEHPTFIWLTAANKTELLYIYAVLVSHNVSVTEFTDPDYDGFDPSAISCLLSQEQRYILSILPLWNSRSKGGLWGRLTGLKKYLRWLPSL